MLQLRREGGLGGGWQFFPDLPELSKAAVMALENRDETSTEEKNLQVKRAATLNKYTTLRSKLSDFKRPAVSTHLMPNPARYMPKRTIGIQLTIPAPSNIKNTAHPYPYIHKIRSPPLKRT